MLRGPLRGLSHPLHILLPDRADCRSGKTLATHLWSEALPSGSFEKVGDGAYMSSPEFCFVQLARTYSRVDLALLGFELCGSYALPPEEGSSCRGCVPATATVYLRSFAERCIRAGIRGGRAALETLKYVLDGAASPMESAIALMLWLPYRFGGYGLPKPVLNHAPRSSGKTAVLADAKPHRCDLIWPQANVALEYDSDAFHPGSTRSRDARRNNSVAAEHHFVFALTKEQLYDIEQFDLTARQLMNALGKKPRMTECPYNWLLRRDELRELVLPRRPRPQRSTHEG